MIKMNEKELLEKIEILEKEVQKYKYDFLTSLKMRIDFYEDLYELYDSEKDFYLLMIDVNGLHAINRKDSYLAGDELIKKVSRILLKYFGNVCYRIGGDEFVVLDTEITMSHRNFFKDIKKYCTISVVKKTSSCKSPDKLIDKADNIIVQNKRKLYNNKEIR